MHPVLFRLGSFEIRFYGLMYVIAIAVGAVLFWREVQRKKLGLTNDEVISYVFWVVVCGILGARLYFVLFMWNQFYAENPNEIFAVWRGGLAIHGGIIGGVAASYLYSRVKKINFLEITDAAVTMLALGQVFGRAGNFMNGDAYGVPTKLPWGMVFPEGSAAGDEFPGVPLHPVMLYELALNLISFFVLWRQRKRFHKSGYIIGLYLLNYGVIRMFASFFRADDLWLGKLRAPHVMSALFIAGAAAFVLKFRLWEGGKNQAT